MKSAQQFFDEANNVVPRISSEEGIAVHKNGDAVFVDVRDTGDIAKSGTIAGAHRIPRGFIEFAADSASPFHNPVMAKDAPICLVCGLGGQAALTGKTLVDMGFTNITNVGGFGDWKDANGPTEDG